MTTSTSVLVSWRSMPSSIATFASSGGASEAAVPSDQRDEHRARRAGGRGAAARAGRAGCARGVPFGGALAVHCGTRPRPARRRRIRAPTVRGLTGPLTSASRGSSRVRNDLLGQALLDDLAVELGALEQLLVVAVGDDPAVVEHDDLIGQRDRGEAVGDDEGGAPGHRLVERELDLLLGRGVDRGGGVVEDQHARVGEQRAGDRQALALAAGERQAALADPRVEALGQARR